MRPCLPLFGLRPLWTYLSSELTIGLLWSLFLNACACCVPNKPADTLPFCISIDTIIKLGKLGIFNVSRYKVEFNQNPQVKRKCISLVGLVFYESKKRVYKFHQIYNCASNLSQGSFEPKNLNKLKILMEKELSEKNKDEKKRTITNSTRCYSWTHITTKVKALYPMPEYVNQRPPLLPENSPCSGTRWQTGS